MYKKVETLVVKTQPIDPLHKRPPSIFLSKPNQFAEIVCERLCPIETANYLFNGLFLLVKKKVRTVSKNTLEKGQQNPRRITEKSFNSPNFDQIFILSPFVILFSTILRAVGDPETPRAKWQRLLSIWQFAATEGNATVILLRRVNLWTKTIEEKQKKRLEPGCNERGERTKKKQNRDCRRRLRGVYDLFWKMVPQKAALKIQQHESYTNTEENNETRTHTTMIHTHIHKHTYIHIPARTGKKREREKEQRERDERA